MAGIWSSLETSYHIIVGSKHIHYFSFTFIAPLETQQDIDFTCIHINYNEYLYSFLTNLAARTLLLGLAATADAINIQTECFFTKPLQFYIIYSIAYLRFVYFGYPTTDIANLMHTAFTIEPLLVVRAIGQTVADD